MGTKYFVDYENVGIYGLKNVSYTNADIIFLFFTENAAKISLDTLSSIGAATQYVPVPAGKQSLDMHLASGLGYEIGKTGTDCSYCVISNDLDYDPVIQYWKSHGVSVKRLSIDPHEIKKSAGTRVRPAKVTQPKSNSDVSKINHASNPQEQKSILNETVFKICGRSKIDNRVIGIVSATVLKHYGQDHAKERVYQDLVKRFGQAKGKIYYCLVKNII